MKLNESDFDTLLVKLNQKECEFNGTDYENYNDTFLSFKDKKLVPWMLSQDHIYEVLNMWLDNSYEITDERWKITNLNDMITNASKKDMKFISPRLASKSEFFRSFALMNKHSPDEHIVDALCNIPDDYLIIINCVIKEKHIKDVPIEKRISVLQKIGYMSNVVKPELSEEELDNLLFPFLISHTKVVSEIKNSILK